MFIPKGADKIAAGSVGHQGKLRVRGPDEPVQAVKDDPVPPQGIYPEQPVRSDLPYPLSDDTDRVPGITGKMNVIVLSRIFFEVPLDPLKDPVQILPQGERLGIDNKEVLPFDPIFPG
jgi:hypothetical protein